MANRRNPLTQKEINARRENAKKSTGPRTEMGKERVRANAVKAGYHADKIAYQAMIALGEDPKEYAETYSILYEEMAPQNGGQVLMVEDVAVLRWQQNRNQRGQAGLIGEQLDELTRRRTKQWKDYEQSVSDAPQEQMVAHGIASLPDSKGKFERIRDLLEILLDRVKKGDYNGETVLNMIYGQEGESVHTASLRGYLQDLKEKSEGATASQEKRWLIEKLEMDLLRWKTAWKEYVETMRPPSQAELNGRFVPKGKAWRALTRQAASLDQRIDKKMRLYWDTQQKDRARIVRQHEESKLEATAEEVAAEQEAKEFIGKLGALIQEMDAKLKAAAEARRAAAVGETAGETGREGAGGGSGGFTPPEREPTGKREPETVGGPSLSTVANKPQ